MEYRQQYKLPFSTHADPDAYYASSVMAAAKESILQCLECGDGIALLIGNNGTGKTLLLRLLAEHFSSTDAVVLFQSRIKSVKGFYQQLLMSLQQTWCGCDENELRLFTWDYLQKNQEMRLFLLMDESQNVPYSVWEEVRTLLDLGRNSQSGIGVVVAGTPNLEERLTHPRFVPLCQRIVCRTWLEPFNSAETDSYIDHVLQNATIPFCHFSLTREAKRLVHRLTEGIPRIVNQLCNRSLLVSLDICSSDIKENKSDEKTAFIQDGMITIDEKMIARTWSLLQQIPEPAISSYSGTSTQVESTPVVSDSSALTENVANSNSIDSSSVVEFGALSDEDSGPDNDETCLDTPLTESAEVSEIDTLADSTPEEEIDECEDESESEKDVESADLSNDQMIRERLLGETPLSRSPEDESEDDSEESIVEVNVSRDSISRIDHEHLYDDSEFETLSDHYLQELEQLEGEVSVEAQVIRQLRDIHLHLKKSHSTAYELSSKQTEKDDIDISFSHRPKNAQTLGTGEKLVTNYEEPPRKQKSGQFRSLFRQIYSDQEPEK